MKIIKRLLPIFAIVLIFLAAFIAGSFSHRDQSDAREVIRSEMDRLKDLGFQNNPEIYLLQRNVPRCDRKYRAI